MILITGAGGQLGRSISDQLARGSERAFVAANRSALDVTSQSETNQHIEQLQPRLVIHAAAMTDVDQCEREPERAWEVNTLGTRNVALACQRVGAKLVAVSTDYVFDGTRIEPYSEADLPSPINVYGKSKLEGERMAQEVCSELFIVRTAWVYSIYGRNFLRTMLKLAESEPAISVVDDQIGTPTWAADLAKQILKLSDTNAFGIYHATSQGSCSWYEFAREIFNVLDNDVELSPIDSSHFPRPAQRPKTCVLENHNLKQAGLDMMPHWHASVATCLASQVKERAA